uniref:Uncharacterized protein n=1 Tax=Rangifer tarandus platyrhynchus TaxID=3082113 RepID=A0ACB0ELR4_RANTA|nr:unnamed protein product [Rangifer tarandus platyrhynchus]
MEISPQTIPICYKQKTLRPATPGTPSSEGTFTSSLSALSFPFHPLFLETQPPKKLSLKTLSPENDARQPLRPHSPERHQRGATHLTSNTEPPLPPAALWPLALPPLPLRPPQPLIAGSPPAKPPARTLPVPGPRPASPEPHRTASPLTGRPAVAQSQSVMPQKPVPLTRTSQASSQARHRDGCVYIEFSRQLVRSSKHVDMAAANHFSLATQPFRTRLLPRPFRCVYLPGAEAGLPPVGSREPGW